MDYAEALHGHIRHRFARAEPRERALVYLRGILDPVGRRNGWQLAAQGGEKYPDGMQRLLSTARWNADRVRDDVRDFVLGHAADRNAVLVVDEWRFPKRGRRSVGVHLAQSSAGRRTENVQTGLFCTYSSQRGSFLVDRELFLPKAWIADAGLRRAARIPEELPYRSPAALAAAMVARAVAARVPGRWVAASASVVDAGLRRFFEKNHMWFLVGVANAEKLPVVIADRRERQSAESLAALLEGDAWSGQPRPWSSYEWTRVRLAPGRPARPVRWLLLRRDAGTRDNLHAYLCQAAPATTLPELVEVALVLERNRYVLAAACSGAGLDEYEVRHWTGWYRYTTLALAAHNCLELAGPRTEPATPVPIPRQGGAHRPTRSRRSAPGGERDPAPGPVARPGPVPEARTPFPDAGTESAGGPDPDPEEESCPSPIRAPSSTPDVPCANRCASTSSFVSGTGRPRRGRSPFPVFPSGRRPGSVR
ncbi:hypothetical protein BU204_21515 [Actinophytocola xanthii]|uniref:Transposase IS701-like DDE domain-containing protein n=1 Tax=Actinophytocola xanthii TaxID=1912961 RepID=A0A1Q8CMC6_9PSEU|nr:hypothetical protein BU204_21515 [Actinophytocola xanthii]